VLSENDDYDYRINNAGDFAPIIARKIERTTCHLSSDSENGSAKQHDGTDVSDIYTVMTWQK
jgi:hypothetical protein